MKTSLLVFFTAISLNAWSAPLAFDVNDVSLLFPLQNGAPYPSISLSATPLISKNIFNEIIHYETPSDLQSDLHYADAIFVADLERWYVTALRFDDCGDVFATQDGPTLKLSKIQGCQPRLRLVAQPFNFSGRPLATALHLLLNLTSQEANQAISLLSLIKSQSSVATTGLPLMVHPGLAAEAKSALKSDLSDLVKKVLTVAPVRLEVLTMTVQTEDFDWKMVGGYIKNGHWNRFVTEHNAKFYNARTDGKLLLGEEHLKCNFYEFCAMFPNDVSRSARGEMDLTAYLLPLSDGSLPAPVHTLETVKIAESIDQPQKSHFFNTNCISCHQSVNFRDKTSLALPYEGPSGITPFTGKGWISDKRWNIISFGYEGATARVSTRTAGESGAVADRVNKKRGLQNPARPLKDANGFWKCINAETEILNCLQKY